MDFPKGVRRTHGLPSLRCTHPLARRRSGPPGRRVAVVGAGPAGLFFSCLLGARYARSVGARLYLEPHAPEVLARNSRTLWPSFEQIIGF